MIEVITNPAAARAYQRAHLERSKAVTNALSWLFGSR
jgi:hypothetical protein